MIPSIFDVRKKQVCIIDLWYTRLGIFPYSLDFFLHFTWHAIADITSNKEKPFY